MHGRSNGLNSSYTYYKEDSGTSQLSFLTIFDADCSFISVPHLDAGDEGPHWEV